jgi:hypothetical protein
MDRRKFLIAAGSTAIGTSALVGSGAFSAGVIQGRKANINVATDRNALLGLKPGHDWDDDNNTVTDNRVFMEEGQLAISFDDSGPENSEGTGINYNSTYQVGAIGFENADWGDGFPSDFPLDSDDVIYGDTHDGSEPTIREDPAFVLVNQSDQDVDINMGYEDVSTPANGDAALLIEPGSPDQSNSSDPNHDEGEIQLGAPIEPGSGLLTAEVPSGAALSFSLIAVMGDPDGTPGDDAWEGSLLIEAEEAIDHTP